MNTTTKETACYYFIVNGFVPELIPSVAFRREKHFKTLNRKILKCPYCGKEFKTIDSAVKVELYCHPQKNKVQYHNSMPCRICHNNIGIIYRSA